MRRVLHHLQQRPPTRTSRAAISARGQWSVQAIHPQPPPILRVNGQLPPQPPSTHLALGQLPSQPAPTEQPGTHHQPLSIQRERPAAIISRRKSGRQSIHRHRKNTPSKICARPATITAIATEQAGTFYKPPPIQSQTASCHHQPPPSKERAGNPFTAAKISTIIMTSANGQLPS